MLKQESFSPVRQHLVGLLIISLATISCGLVAPNDSKNSQNRSASSVMAIAEQITPITAKPGDVLEVKGKNFSAVSGIKVRFTLSDASLRDVDLSVATPTSASFVMPDGVGLGLKHVLILQGDVLVGTLRLVANTADNSLPILIDDSGEVCITKDYIDRNGDKKTGTKNCSAGLAACSQDGQRNCVVAGNYAAANTTDIASKIPTGQTIAGVPGSIENCTAGGSNCFLPRYAQNMQVLKAIDFQNNVQRLDPWDVRVGVTVNGVPNYGKLKVHCRNRVLSGVYNYDGYVTNIGSSGVISGGLIDIWDTIDDGYTAPPGLSPSIVPGWGDADCRGVEKTAGDDNVWKDVTTTSEGVASTCDADADRCTMQDKITRLWWSKSQGNKSGNRAWGLCSSLNHNGQAGWRLPTQKELMEAYTHGIKSASHINWIAEADMNRAYFSGSYYTAVTQSDISAWQVNLANGSTFWNWDYPHWTFREVVCVR
jgi:hypothetical protein